MYPSFLHSVDIPLDVPDIGPSTSLGRQFLCRGRAAGKLGWFGRHVRLADRHPYCALRNAVTEFGKSVVRPEDDSICGIKHVLWYDKPGVSSDGRDAVILRRQGHRQLTRRHRHLSADRASLGQGSVRIGQTCRNESLIGTVFEGIREEEVMVGPYRGIHPSITG